jgi:MscS family membrane protein
VVLVAHEWGYDINGFIAGLGLGGLAIALAAKDALANIFGGVVIIMEKPFSIGDQIQTPTVEGKVEDISFRSTRFRNAEHALVTVPNSTLANEAITNLSRMGKRRIKLSLLLDLPGTRNEIETCLVKIRELLAKHPGLYTDTISVHLQSLGTNSLEVSVTCFTRTIENEEYLDIKEHLNYGILDILRAEKISLASSGRVSVNDGFKNSMAES